jgi:hypothetical protein
VAQDFYDILQPFDFLVDLLDNNKAALGLRYIAKMEEQLVPEYPAILIAGENTQREYHATQIHLVRFFIDIWVFHAELTKSKSIRSREDIEMATTIRKLIHSNRTMSGHIIDGYVSSEQHVNSTRLIGQRRGTIVSTRLTWQGENRVPYALS